MTYKERHIIHSPCWSGGEYVAPTELDFINEFQPPVETGGYKYFAPTER